LKLVNDMFFLTLKLSKMCKRKHWNPSFWRCRSPVFREQSTQPPSTPLRWMWSQRPVLIQQVWTKRHSGESSNLIKQSKNVIASFIYL